MTRDLDAISYDSECYDDCVCWCNKDHVIVERIPKVNVFNLRFWWSQYNYGLRFDKYTTTLRLWHLNIQYNKEYTHKNGKIVYDPLIKKQP